MSLNGKQKPNTEIPLGGLCLSKNVIKLLMMIKPVWILMDVLTQFLSVTTWEYRSDYVRKSLKETIYCYSPSL